MSKVPENNLSRKELILQTAVSELIEHGIEGVRIETILEKSGSSFSSLYHHFDSRENLITAALVALFQTPVDDDISLFIEKSSDSQSLAEVLEALTAGVRSILEPAGVQQRQAQFRIIAAALDRPDLREALRQGQQQMAQRLVSHLEKLQGAGAIPASADPKEFAWYVLQMAMGLVVTDINSEDITQEERISLVVKSLIGILEPKF